MKARSGGLTKERACELLRYEPESGKLFWRVTRNGYVKAGSEANSKHETHRTIYIRVNIDNYRHYAHRVVWIMNYGDFPDDGYQIDHIDGDGCNNRLSNLRLVSGSDNCRNKRENASNTSGCCGVSYMKKAGKWMAYINIIKNKQSRIGLFDTLEEAIAARKKAERDYGYFKLHGGSR